MYYLYLCICTSAKCTSVELKVYLFIWSHNFQFSMSLSLSPNSLYHQTTDCTEGGGLTREHVIWKKMKFLIKILGIFGRFVIFWFNSNNPGKVAHYRKKCNGGEGGSNLYNFDTFSLYSSWNSIERSPMMYTSVSELKIF